MLEQILKMYSTYMMVDVRSPVPHLFGPPGAGKSTIVEQAAEIIGVNLHVINVSRISPLELEGVQMPVSLPKQGDEDAQELILKLLHATFWTQLREGDILLLDEFLRGFPEVYNGLLDILTSRQVGGFKLPKVFIIAASNSTVSYDKALEDRLLHLPVPDPRKRKTEQKKLGQLVVDALGLLPEMVTSMEMQDMITTEVLPMYDILDNLKNKSSAPASLKGCSIRNLIGQAQLREVQSTSLAEVLKMNNLKALQQGKLQYVFYTTGKNADPTYQSRATKLLDNPRLTEVQTQNIQLNLQLIEMEQIRHNKEGTTDDDVIDELNDVFS